MTSPAPAPASSPLSRYNGVSCFHSVPCACHCPDDKYTPSDPLLQKDPADSPDPERLMPVPGCEHTFTKWIDHKRSADRLLDPGLSAARTLTDILNATASIPADEFMNCVGGKESLEATAADIAAGNLQPVHTMLFSQATILSQLFMYLSRVAVNAGPSDKNSPANLRIAVHAQRQSASTVRDLTRLTHPALYPSRRPRLPSPTPTPTHNPTPPPNPAPISNLPSNSSNLYSSFCPDSPDELTSLPSPTPSRNEGPRTCSPPQQPEPPPLTSPLPESSTSFCQNPPPDPPHPPKSPPPPPEEPVSYISPPPSYLPPPPSEEPTAPIPETTTDSGNLYSSFCPDSSPPLNEPTLPTSPLAPPNEPHLTIFHYPLSPPAPRSFCPSPPDEPTSPPPNEPTFNNSRSSIIAPPAPRSFCPDPNPCPSAPSAKSVVLHLRSQQFSITQYRAPRRPGRTFASKKTVPRASLLVPPPHITSSRDGPQPSAP